MNHVVCIAHVPDTETKIRIGADGKSIDETDVKWIVSPYDEYALEEALKMKEAKGGTVTVVTYGPPAPTPGCASAWPARRRGRADCVRRDGCDRLAGRGADSRGGREGPAARRRLDGEQGGRHRRPAPRPDGGRAARPAHVTLVTKLEWGEGKVTAKREIEGATEVVEAPLPVVLGAQKGLNEPRYASLKGIMAAKKKAIAVKQPAEVGYEAAAGAAVAWTKLELPAARGAVKLVPADDPNKAAEELLKLLRDEAKVL